jgi:hypothetical protein
MGTWWPLAIYKIGKASAVDAVIEPRVGGRRFIAAAEGGTRVELEHRKLDRYAARRAEMRRIFDTEGDWGRLLAMFAAAAEGEGA